MFNFLFFPLVGSNGSDFKAAKTPRGSFLRRTGIAKNKISDYFEQYGMLGIRTGLVEEHGYNLVVVDLDYERGGKDQDIFLDLPDAPTVKTPHGKHMYYRVPEGFKTRNSKDIIAPGVDTRGESGYVVAPGSVYYDLMYEQQGEWPEKFEDFPLLPDVFLARLERKEKVRDVADQWFDDEDTEQAAIAYIICAEPKEVGSRSDTVYVLACELKNLGIRETKCLTLFEKYLNKDLLSIGTQRLKDTIKNAYTYSVLPGGVKNAENLPAAPTMEGEKIIEPVKEENKKVPDDMDKTRLLADRWNLKNAGEKIEPVEQEWIIHELLPRRGLVMLYGAPGSGKSFISVDLAHRISTGVEWCGRRVEQMDVLYLACEARTAFPNRLIAARYRPGSDIIADRLWYHPHPIIIREGQPDLGTLKAHLRLNSAIGLVIIDTVARSIGGSENEDTTVKSYLNGLQRVVNEYGVTCMFVHHSGKDIHKGARGHSDFSGFSDVILSTLPVYGEGENAKVSGYSLRVEKQSEGIKGLEFEYQIRPVVLGQGKYGPIKSCYIDYTMDDPNWQDAIKALEMHEQGEAEKLAEMSDMVASLLI